MNCILGILLTALAKRLPAGVRNLLLRPYNYLRDRSYRTDGVWIWYERGPVLYKVEALLGYVLSRSNRPASARG